jgi:DNA-binding beta-propeller fold protein YncE
MKVSTDQVSTIAVDKGNYRIKEVAVHATGLRLPSHMGITNDGRVLVSEFAAGNVRDVTKPGDYTDQSKGLHAWNMKHPGGILPLSDGRVWAADSGSGNIYDITQQEKVTESSLIFEGVPHPYGLVEFNNSVFTSFSNDSMVGIAEIIPGQQYSLERNAYVHGFPVVVTMEPYRTLMGCGGSWSTPTMDGRLLLGHAALGAIFDVTSGGSFEDLRNNRYAWGLNLPLGMITDPLDGNIYVTERSTGVIKRVPRAGGYSRFAEPFLAGFHEPSCIRFTPDGKRAYVCDRGWDTVYRIELEHQEE